MEEMEKLQLQVEMGRSIRSEDVLDSTIKEQTIVDSSSEVEMWNDDRCHTDSEWSDSDVVALGIKSKQIVNWLQNCSTES